MVSLFLWWLSYNPEWSLKKKKTDQIILHPSWTTYLWQSHKFLRYDGINNSKCCVFRILINLHHRVPAQGQGVSRGYCHLKRWQGRGTPSQDENMHRLTERPLLAARWPHNMGHFSQRKGSEKLKRQCPLGASLQHPIPYFCLVLFTSNALKSSVKGQGIWPHLLVGTVEDRCIMLAVILSTAVIQLCCHVLRHVKLTKLFHVQVAQAVYLCSRSF